MLSIDISKQQQSSDWGAPELSKAQIEYAASDVLYLHNLMDKLNVNLERENRMEMAEACFNFLPTRAKLDLAGWSDHDIFCHT
jgi:ribonuclease D